MLLSQKRINVGLDRHRVDLAKVEAQQPNALAALFSALETFFFAVLSASNLKKRINSKKIQPLPTQDWYERPCWYIPPHFHRPHAFIAPKTTEKHFQNIFEIESMLQISVNFFFLAPAAKSHAGKLEGCNVLIESVWNGQDITSRERSFRLTLTNLVISDYHHPSPFLHHCQPLMKGRTPLYPPLRW